MKGFAFANRINSEIRNNTLKNKGGKDNEKTIG
jgi:hypothetical protein